MMLCDGIQYSARIIVFYIRKYKMSQWEKWLQFNSETIRAREEKKKQPLETFKIAKEFMRINEWTFHRRLCVQIAVCWEMTAFQWNSLSLLDSTDFWKDIIKQTNK